MGDNKNFFLAIALSMVVLLGWQFLVGIPDVQKKQAKQEQSQNTKDAGGNGAGIPVPSSEAQSPKPEAAVPGQTPPIPVVNQAEKREESLSASPRIAIETGALTGSIALKGARLDDLKLSKYRESVDKKSGNIALLSPSGSKQAYYAEHGWTVTPGEKAKLPGPGTLWTAQDNNPLTPEHPVMMTYDNEEGLIFRRTFSVDENYMFTVVQEVENKGANAITLFPYALISRHGMPESQSFYILHEGLVGVLGEEGLEEISYDDIREDGSISMSATGGWLGITDKYWATVIAPDQTRAYKARFSENAAVPDDIFQVDYLLGAVKIEPGGKQQVTGHVFAGAKKVSVIDGYQDNPGIKQFELLIDWGWFYFITKPLFKVLEYFYQLIGNFGIAILIVTVIIKLLFFPLANKSYVSMSKMKKLQPEVNKLKERYKDDKVKQQQGQMELFKKHKVNPMSGCLPMLIQIPVFFALYKVLFVTIEMRHAPFFGWIHDLAAPDPTSVFNLFGLLPFDPPQMLMLGVWPLIMGITMWIQMKLNPTPADAMQQKIFTWMPVIFTFMLASFPAGLVIYWAWNNVLSTAQQATIMKRQGVKIELFGNLLKTLGFGKEKGKAG